MSLTPEKCRVCGAKLKNGRVEGCSLPRNLNVKIGQLADMERGKRVDESIFVRLVALFIRTSYRKASEDVLRVEIEQMEEALKDCWGTR